MVNGTTAVVTQWVQGTAEKVEEKGFSLTVAGRTGPVLRRLLVSRYASPPPVLPQVGQRVRVGLDKSGYVRVVDALPDRTEATAAAPTLPTTTEAAEPPGLTDADLVVALDDPAAEGAEPEDLPFPSRPEPSVVGSAVPSGSTMPERSQQRPGPATVSTRLTCLTAAATVLAGRTPTPEAAAVLALAEQFERWVTRPEADEKAP